DRTVRRDVGIGAARGAFATLTSKAYHPRRAIRVPLQCTNQLIAGRSTRSAHQSCGKDAARGAFDAPPAGNRSVGSRLHHATRASQ
ncbi:MAG: hypothetical protein ACREHD_18985, partial [Pirellulales bacterium]